MRSPLNACADWINRRSDRTQDTLATAMVCLMVSTFITIAAVGIGMGIMPVLFG